MLLGAALVFPSQEFSLAALARLLRKALFANPYKKAAGGKREGWNWETAVVPILTSAKRGMWPVFRPEPGPEPRQAVKQRRWRRSGALRRSWKLLASRVRSTVRKQTLQRACR